MHTPPFTSSLSRRSVPTPPPPSPFIHTLSVLIVGSLLAGLAQHATAQSQFPGVSDEQSTNLRVYPSDLWGIRTGPGVGLGFVVHNLARHRDQWLLTAAPALHEQVGTLSFASANPGGARQYVLADVRGLHTDRDWIGGRDQSRLTLERSSLHARLRFGQSYLDQRFLLQPFAVASHHSVNGVSWGNTGETTALEDGGLPVPRPQQTGIRPGINVRYDTRDRTPRTTSGLLLQGTVGRYLSLDGSSLRFDQFDLAAYAYLPLGNDHRVALRASAAVTRVRGKPAVPVYMRPRLGGALVPGFARGQFVGHDRLIGSSMYRFPLKNVLGLVALEAHLGAHVAREYDNVGSQFVPRISFDDEHVQSDASYPLRPAASAGLRVLAPARDHASIEFAVGASPSGITGVSFSFVHSLQALRPPHHTLDHQW